MYSLFAQTQGCGHHPVYGYLVTVIVSSAKGTQKETSIALQFSLQIFFFYPEQDTIPQSFQISKRERVLWPGQSGKAPRRRLNPLQVQIRPRANLVHILLPQYDTITYYLTRPEPGSPLDFFSLSCPIISVIKLS